MARKKELTTVADKLEQLEELQAIHSKIDAIHILKGELPIEVADLEDRLIQALGTKVRIQHKGKKGKIEIEYYSLDELDRLLELFLGM